ncbi:hypothetical protein FOZ60_001737 [Perkinsus olseni]|uniref:Uncharacterized protein n=1 Tax=Perkinsus olseni TaxID=32597 RepID=A0A7J6NZL3_PEROL|nr:hypothetical protein FOZ60_001737 [Perkinsus olseni]
MGCTSSTLPVDVEAYESVYASPTAKRRRRAKPLGVYEREGYQRGGHRLSSQETDPGGSSPSPPTAHPYTVVEYPRSWPSSESLTRRNDDFEGMPSLGPGVQVTALYHPRRFSPRYTR